MDATPKGNRLHIVIFGRRNAGKSSLINALTNQNIAVVSDVPGTTTDPVFKTMEILPLGPVVLIDTAGIDDTGRLGELRIERSLAVFNQADLVLIVLDAGTEVSKYEKDILERCNRQRLPVVIIVNKIDTHPVTPEELGKLREKLGEETVAVSAKTKEGINELKQVIIRRAPSSWNEQSIVGDLLNPGDMAILVTPIDLAAPKGRLILPQVQTIRDILDHDAMAYVVKERELKECLATLTRKPKIVITDSQAFLKADADTPPDVLLTSFSILFARYKGDLEALVNGAQSIERLKPGAKILMAEACTHHSVEDDIGRVKIPRWLRQTVGGELEFHHCSGTGFPTNLKDYQLIVHCGGCMLNRREMLYRILVAQEAGVPIVNYGLCIAYVHGILRRALSPFPLIQEQLDDEMNRS